MSSNNVHLSEKECIITVNPYKKAFFYLCLIAVSICFCVFYAWGYSCWQGEKGFYTSTVGFILCLFLSVYFIVWYIKVRRTPSKTIVLNSTGITFPDCKSISWEQVYYMYFKNEGRGGGHQLHIVAKRQYYPVVEDIHFAGYYFYIGHRDFIYLIEKYAQRHLFVSEKMYQFSHPSEVEIQRFRDEQRKAGKRLRNKRQF